MSERDKTGEEIIEGIEAEYAGKAPGYLRTPLRAQAASYTTGMITLFADASYDHRARLAGWGAWAIRSEWRSGRTFGGVIRRELNNASEAELAAIASAIYRVRADGGLDGMTTIMVQSDCVRALQVILENHPDTTENRHKHGAPVHRLYGSARKLSLSPNERDAFLFFQQGAEALRVQVRHVRGHTQGKGRQWVNRECDAIAKRFLEIRRGGLTT